MRLFLSHYIQFILILVLWIIAGAFGGILSFALILPTILLFRYKKRFFELFLGFLFILILSDSRHPALAFAGQVKNVYIVLLALFVLVNKKMFSFSDLFIKWFLPFLGVAFLCLYNSEGNFLAGIQKTLSYGLILFVVPVYITKLYEDGGEKAFSSFIYFVTLLVYIGLFLKILAPELVTLEGRFTGLLGNPNGLGIFLLLFFILFSTILNYFPSAFSKTDKRIVYAGIFLSLIFCQSRSALFGIGIFLLFMYLYRLSSFLGFIIFLGLILSYQLITSNIESIIIGLGLEEFFRLETLDTGSGRLIAWQFAWENAQKSFFFGKGFGYTEFLFKQNYNYLSVLGHQGNAHNSYLTFWLDTGIIGLILFLRGFILVFFKGMKNSIVAIPALYAILFSAFFESWLTASLNPFTIQVFIILTIITGYSFNTNNELKPTSELQPVV